ncbi:DUF1338 domain-containing protein [Neptuniibacter sp. CAU 1671]|uniref:DUF1338 domain-containing protein n=1 Tax=Neptuniibacter sp. CAU 1671 TaxID=3032593 RepID=UPI0023DBB628|nr:DUF1338 domain-containing protein [Neptuniibacter sp. CAU 1671]MDF2182531.1 DUF1338 domain-containing protein [Neptuniibacter sp. CAU 1671]
MNPETLQQHLQAMWLDYLQLNPQARLIHGLFRSRNPELVNDHIALRTFDLPEVDLNHLARPFQLAGYDFAGEYHFPDKHLYARHLQHPDRQLPKIFISQLITAELGAVNNALVHKLISQIPASVRAGEGFCYSGRHWELSWREYQQLLAESEYAAWVAAFGFRPNHFTLFVNALQSHTSIAAVNTFLTSRGVQLNTAGGAIKGSPEVGLEQSSTLASRVPVTFSDGIHHIPGCYYEFASRFPLADGELYQGFVTDSANQIFHSTDSRQGR